MYNNNLRQIRIILYRLKRSYGLPLRIRHPLSLDNDILTGEITKKYQEISIKRAIVLPASELSKFSATLASLRSNANFRYGGTVDTNTRNVIIDVKDLPIDFKLTTEDHVVFEDRAYQIKDFQLAEHNQGYLLTVVEITSSDSEPVTPPAPPSGPPFPPFALLPKIVVFVRNAVLPEE